MAPIYREITLEWNGKTYQVTPTFGFIQRIEQRLSLASLLDRAMSGNPPLSLLAELLAETLRAAGCKDEDATAENINAELYDEASAHTLTQAASQILFALLPQKPLRGNLSAPVQGAKPSQTSIGPSTTRSPSATSESNPPSFGR